MIFTVWWNWTESWSTPPWHTSSTTFAAGAGPGSLPPPTLSISTGTYLLCYTLPQVLCKQWGLLLPYWYSFGGLVVTLLVTSHLLLRRGIFYKLIYISFCTAFVQIFKMVCLPLYEQETAMPRPVYAVWDVATNALLLVTLLVLFWLFVRFPIVSTLHLPPYQCFPPCTFPSACCWDLCSSTRCRGCPGTCCPSAAASFSPICRWPTTTFFSSPTAMRNSTA